MDLLWLESLLALVEHGSFTRAAESLHVSQPAFSRRIRALEQWAGVQLVDRSTFPVALTPAGTKLRPWAAELVTGLDSLRDELRGRQLMPADAVRIATSHTLATHYFAAWWRDLATSGPEMTCVIMPQNTLEAYDALLHGGCELLLAYTDPGRPLNVGEDGVESVVLAHDWLRPYARCRDGTPELFLPGSALHPVPFVSHGAGAFLGRVTDGILSRQRAYLRPVAQSDLTSALAELVFAGVGVGWLPGLIATNALAHGGVGVIEDPAWSAKLEIRLFRSRHRRLSRGADELWRRAGERAAGE